MEQRVESHECGHPALMTYEDVPVAESPQPIRRLSDVACSNPECESYVFSERVVARLGHDPRIPRP